MAIITSTRLDPDFVLTDENERIYRQVRRYYAEQDVRQVLSWNSLEAENDVQFQQIVDLYDTWQGDNGFWADACYGIIRDVLGDAGDL